MNTKPLTREQSKLRLNRLIKEFTRMKRRLSLAECNAFLKPFGEQIGQTSYFRVKTHWDAMYKKKQEALLRQKQRAAQKKEINSEKQLEESEEEGNQVHAQNGVILRSKERMVITQLLRLLGPDSTFQITREGEKFYGFVRVRGINTQLTGTIDTID